MPPMEGLRDKTAMMSWRTFLLCLFLFYNAGALFNFLLIEFLNGSPSHLFCFNIGAAAFCLCETLGRYLIFREELF